jgi:hypothetical protein
LVFPSGNWGIFLSGVFRLSVGAAEGCENGITVTPQIAAFGSSYKRHPVKLKRSLLFVI